MLRTPCSGLRALLWFLSRSSSGCLLVEAGGAAWGQESPRAEPSREGRTGRQALPGSCGERARPLARKWEGAAPSGEADWWALVEAGPGRAARPLYSCATPHSHQDGSLELQAGRLCPPALLGGLPLLGEARGQAWCRLRVFTARPAWCPAGPDAQLRCSGPPAGRPTRPRSPDPPTWAHWRRPRCPRKPRAVGQSGGSISARISSALAGLRRLAAGAAGRVQSSEPRGNSTSHIPPAPSLGS